MQYKQCELALIKIYTEQKKRKEEILNVSSGELCVMHTPIFSNFLIKTSGKSSNLCHIIVFLYNVKF